MQKSRVSILVALAVVALLNLPARAEQNDTVPVKGGGEKAEEIANSFIKAIGKCDYSFLTEDEIAGLRREICDFAGQYLHGRMSDAEFKTLIAAIEKYSLRHVKSDDSVSKLYALEMGYFEFRDQVNTFKWLLWQALTRKPQTAGDIKRRNTQHKWLKEFIKTVPARPGDYVPEGIKRDEMYKWAEDVLEQKFANPLSLMFEAMTDEQFENFKEWMKRSSANGLSQTVSDIRCRVIGAHAHKHGDVEGVYQYPFDIELPFEDEVISMFGGRNSHLAFASNAQFRGKEIFMNARGHSILDVAKLSTMPVEVKADDGKLEEHFIQWVQQHNKGDLAYLDTNAKVITLRGAKLAELKVANWFEADRLSNDELRESINNSGRTEISVKKLPPVNGPFRLDTRVFIAVETAEKRLAVIALKNREFGQLYMRCRARDVDSTEHKAPVEVEGEKPTIIFTDVDVPHGLNPVIYKDEHYSFFERDYGAEGTQVPGLFVFSHKQKKWKKIIKLSTERAKLGRSPIDTDFEAGPNPCSVSWGYSQLREIDYVTMLLMTSGSVNFPDVIHFDKQTSEYFLLFNSSWNIEAVLTEFVVRKSDIDQAFNNKVETEEGADVNAKDTRGRTPLDYATRKKHQKVVDVLIKKGALLGSELISK